MATRRTKRPALCGPAFLFVSTRQLTRRVVREPGSVSGQLNRVDAEADGHAVGGLQRGFVAIHGQQAAAAVLVDDRRLAGELRLSRVVDVIGHRRCSHDRRGRPGRGHRLRQVELRAIPRVGECGAAAGNDGQSRYERKKGLHRPYSCASLRRVAKRRWRKQATWPAQFPIQSSHRRVLKTEFHLLRRRRILLRASADDRVVYQARITDRALVSARPERRTQYDWPDISDARWPAGGG